MLSICHLTALANNGIQNCLIEKLQSAADETTVGKLRNQCAQEARIESGAALGLTPIGERILQKHSFRGNTFEMSPHRPNYLLPLTYIDQPNQAPFADLYGEQLQHQEMQFQISFKTTLFKGILGDGELIGAYTNRSFWQAYNLDISRPFRETNHEPELMLSFDSDRQLFGFTNTENSLVFNHQSNGQYGDLSRSWNRLMLKSIWERDNYAFTVRPWYRIPESEGDGPADPEGDDNPDITDYLGHFDFHGAYTRDDHTLTLMLRNNFKSENQGAIELGWSFPFPYGEGLRGYLKYFNGYGESLIDYNQSTESIAFGFEINGWGGN